MVEFALIALLYFTVIFLIIETGLLIRQYNTVALVTHEAARYACVRKDDSKVPDFVQQRLNMLGLPDPHVLSVTRSTEQVCIEITYTWVPITPIVGRILGTKIPLTKNACMPLMQ